MYKHNTEKNYFLLKMVDIFEIYGEKLLKTIIKIDNTAVLTKYYI